jgi:hypothetical protein
MREDIARSQQIEDLTHQRRRLDAADMDHDLRRPPRHLAGLDGPLQRFGPVLEDNILGHPNLGPDGEIRVLGDRQSAGLHLRVVEVVQLCHREGGQAVVGDVDEGEHPRPRLGGDVAPERRDVVGSRIARRDDRGHARERDGLVRRDADRRAVGIGVGVEIDEPRQHELARGIDRLLGALGGDIRLKGGHHAEADADVALGAQRLARVDDLPTLDHQVEAVGHGGSRPHGRHSASEAEPSTTRQLGHGPTSLGAPRAVGRRVGLQVPLHGARSSTAPRRSVAFAMVKLQGFGQIAP